MVISYDDAINKLIFASMLMYKLDASHFFGKTEIKMMSPDYRDLLNIVDME